MKKNTLSVTLGLLALLTLSVEGLAAPSGKKYYLYLFGMQDRQAVVTDDTRVEYTHTWAALAEVDGTKIEYQSISWLPRKGLPDPMRLGPQRGQNKSLADSLADVTGYNLRLGQWGPYEVNAELNTLFKRQVERLATGDVWYRVLDTPNRIFKVLDPSSVLTPPASNCFNAVSDVLYGTDPKGFLLQGSGRGFEATAKVAWHFTDYYERSPRDVHYLTAIPAATEQAMDTALGLSGYRRERLPLERRQNRYCATLEECRGASGLGFGG